MRQTCCNIILWTLLVSVLVTQPISSAAATSAQPAEVIENFYRHYFTVGHPGAAEPEFSNSFKALRDKEHALCRKYWPCDLCGWPENFDPYLAAQDYEDNLTYERAQTRVKELEPGVVAVWLNLFPSSPSTEPPRQPFVYRMVQEDGQWVVDDVLDPHREDNPDHPTLRNASSAREIMAYSINQMPTEPSPCP